MGIGTQINTLTECTSYSIHLKVSVTNMEKKQYYAICLDEYAMVSFCSFTKKYYGTEDDMMQFAKALETNNTMSDLVQSLNEFSDGNKDVQYYAAYNNHRLATPVIFHPENHLTLTDYEWEHLNIWFSLLYACRRN